MIVFFVSKLEAQLKEYVNADDDALDGSTDFQHAWELDGDKSLRLYGQGDHELARSKRARIARYVAVSKEVLNLSNLSNWVGSEFRESDGFVPDNMLSVPIFNGQRDLIGVAQLINKVTEKLAFYNSRLVCPSANAMLNNSKHGIVKSYVTKMFLKCLTKII